MTKTVETSARFASGRRVRNVRALSFAIATGVIAISGALAVPQQAKAFGISDVTGYVEDVWEIGADATERAGRAIGEKVRDLNSGEITSNNPRPPRKVTGKPKEGGNARLPSARNPAGSSLPPARGAASSTSGGLPTSGNSALPPARGAASSASSASGGLPTSGNSALPPARGTASNSGSSLPAGNSALPPARGDATSGSNGSGSALPPARRKNERIIVKQRPKPITEEDIKPSKPICNSKFENCHGKKGKKHGKKWNKHGARDKSIWGHKAGNKKFNGHKRNERKLRIKTHDNRKLKIRVNNQKRGLRIMRKSNRRG